MRRLSQRCPRTTESNTSGSIYSTPLASSGLPWPLFDSPRLPLSFFALPRRCLHAPGLFGLTLAILGSPGILGEHQRNSGIMSGHANMALAREYCLFLVLFILVSLARCENKAPKVSLRGRVDYLRRGAPSADSPVPPDHVFYQNHQLDFSWTDPALQMALWRGLKTEQQLQAEFGAKVRRKRQTPGSSGPTNTNPNAVFKLPSCAGCVAAASGAPPPTLQSLSVQFLQNQITYSQPQLYNGCVFYTAVVGPTDFVVRRRLGGTDVHPGLSKIASDWACSNGRKSIWVSQILGTVWRRPRRKVQ